ncbi:hypothetical protein HBA55_34875 [Pseudomaricurvus alkylphenolicus]|uniref:hypothetical protein n=1 Tax=Pseudomaricurvus alkylphenolicus TaxID=1306991 RepID=UPI00142186FD|nr:hypothetical protein [Pseudomaricurvus alkylphenolicus]NIB44817.1 hypothetical protein [Pseudomaricurvus alkylphenolicus]
MIKYQVADLPRLRQAFGEETVRRSMNTALTRTRNKVKTSISRSVRDWYSIKTADVKAAVKVSVHVSSDGIMRHVLSYSGFRRSLRHYATKPGVGKVWRTSRGRRVQARVKLYKKQHLVEDGFWGAAKFQQDGEQKSELQIFKRNPQKRMKSNRKKQQIVKQSAPSISQMVRNVDVLDRFNKLVEEELPVQFDKALRARLGEFDK